MECNQIPEDENSLNNWELEALRDIALLINSILQLDESSQLSSIEDLTKLPQLCAKYYRWTPDSEFDLPDFVMPYFLQAPFIIEKCEFITRESFDCCLLCGLLCKCKEN